MQNNLRIETNAQLLLLELEQAIKDGTDLPARVILQMDCLKKAIDDCNAELGSDLEKLYRQTLNNVKN
jgi:hypothetical protein